MFVLVPLKISLISMWENYPHAICLIWICISGVIVVIVLHSSVFYVVLCMAMVFHVCICRTPTSTFCIIDPFAFKCRRENNVSSVSYLGSVKCSWGLIVMPPWPCGLTVEMKNFKWLVLRGRKMNCGFYTADIGLSI